MNTYIPQGVTCCQSCGTVNFLGDPIVVDPIEELKRSASLVTEQGTILVLVKTEDDQEFLINPTGGYERQLILIAEGASFPKTDEGYSWMVTELRKKLESVFKGGKTMVKLEDGRQLLLTI